MTYDFIGEHPNRDLNFLFPNEACIKDFDTGELDTAKHPIIFIINNYSNYNSLGFKLTSHPKPHPLNDFFYITLSKDTDFENSEKESSTIKCDHIIEFGEGYDNKNPQNHFRAKGNIKPNKYNQIMTEVITRHILLQEQRLATKDPSTELLLIELEIEKEDIITSPLYQKLETELFDKNKKLPAGQRNARLRAIEEQRTKVKNLEESKQI